MSPRNDNQNQPQAPDTMVNIDHDENTSPPVSAPPLPIVEAPQPVQPTHITANVSAAPPVVPPPDMQEFHEDGGRRLPMIILYIILAFLVAVLVVFAGRWVYKKVTHKDKPSVPVKTQPMKTPSLPTGNPTPAPSATPTTNGQLPNNGPGDVVALFVGTALVIGGLHYLYSLRRAA